MRAADGLRTPTNRVRTPPNERSRPRAEVRCGRNGFHRPRQPAGHRTGAVSMSWDEAFANQYEEWSAHMTADVAFYVELARQADGPLVELAIGNGRVAIPVAQATGQRVVGIDSSRAMLAQARANAAEVGVELDLREGDMRDFTLDEPAALI